MDRPEPRLRATTCAPIASILPTGWRPRTSRTRPLATFTAAAALALSLSACSPSGSEEPPTEMAASEATTTVVPDVVGLPLDVARDVDAIIRQVALRMVGETAAIAVSRSGVSRSRAARRRQRGRSTPRTGTSARTTEGAPRLRHPYAATTTSLSQLAR